MKRIIFVILSCVTAFLSAGALGLFVSDYFHDYPDQYRLATMLAIPIFALISIVCYIIQSVMKDKEWKKYQAEHPEEAQRIKQQIHDRAVNSVGDYDLYQLGVLRGRIVSIFGRIIVSAVITGLLGGNILISYIWVSYCWFFIKLTRNYIIGIVACLICVYYFADKFSSLPQPWFTIWSLALIGSAFIIDLVNIIRYIALKRKIAKAGMAIRKLSREEKIAFRNAK